MQRAQLQSIRQCWNAREGTSDESMHRQVSQWRGHESERLADEQRVERGERVESHNGTMHSGTHLRGDMPVSGSTVEPVELELVGANVENGRAPPSQPFIQRIASRRIYGEKRVIDAAELPDFLIRFAMHGLQLFQVARAIHFESPEGSPSQWSPGAPSTTTTSTLR